MKLSFLLAVIFLFFLPRQAFAANTDIVINEVLPDPDGSDDNEFIELYNKGNETVTITGWKLSDIVGSTDTYIISEDSISPGSYRYYRKSITKISLNNTEGDGVILKDSADQPVGSPMSYNSVIEGKSWSRIPNGTGDFANNTTPTENAANLAPPTPTPTNTPTPGPTATPTKTPTPTPLPAASATNTPTPTKKPIATPTLKVSPNPNATMEATMMRTTAADLPQQDVKGEGVDLGGELKDLDKKETQYNWSKLLILMGAVLVTCACGILVYNNYLKDRLEEMRAQ